MIVQLRLAVVAAQASTEQRVRAEFALVEEKLRRELDTYFYTYTFFEPNAYTFFEPRGTAAQSSTP